METETRPREKVQKRVKRIVSLVLMLTMLVGILTPLKVSAASKNVIRFNVSSSAVTKNATDGNLPSAASPAVGKSYYFNIQVSSDLKVKKAQLYVKDVGNSSYSCVFTDTANNYMRYTSYKYTFSKAGTVSYYWKLTYTNGSTKTTSKTSVTVSKGTNTITCSDVTLTKSSSSQTGSLGATVKDSATLTYSSNNSKVTVDKKGKYTVAANWTGTATITIKAAATSNYKAATKTVTIKVNSVAISTNWTTSNNKTVKQSSDSSFYISVNGTKFTVSNTFYTYSKSGSKYQKSTGGSAYYVKVGSSYVYVGAAQCLGFAHNVEYLLYGKYDGTDSSKNSGFSEVTSAAGLTLNSSTDTSKLKSYITTAGAGAHIRINCSSSGSTWKHSLIVISVDSKGFYYCDANGTNGNNIISVGYFTWSDFAKHSSYSSIKYIRYYAG